jgi:4-amino-4-deoxy-L-arabinose transferase-like glycosyltransferase
MAMTLGAVLGTRLIVWAAGLAVIAILGDNVNAVLALDPNGLTHPFHSVALDRLVAPGARWDAVWYLWIAQHGYTSPATGNFFPLYPLLVRLGAGVFGPPLVVGILISITSMLVGLTVLYRLARLDLDEPAARLTILLVALFPTSLFFSAVYTTSLFLMLTVGAVYAARRERWALAGLCGGLAAATESNGIIIVVPLALLYLYGPRVSAPTSPSGAWWRPRFRVSRSAAWLLLVPVGLAAYLGYVTIAHGDPLAPYRAATVDWGRSFAGPFGAIARAFEALPIDLHRVLAGTTRSIGAGDPISWNARDLIDLVFLAVAFAGMAAARRRVPLAYYAYAVGMLAHALSFPSQNEAMLGLSRYMLPVFPLFMGVATRLRTRQKLTLGFLGVSAVLLAVFSGLWAYWALVP